MSLFIANLDTEARRCIFTLIFQPLALASDLLECLVPGLVRQHRMLRSDKKTFYGIFERNRVIPYVSPRQAKVQGVVIMTDLNPLN